MVSLVEIWRDYTGSCGPGGDRRYHLQDPDSQEIPAQPSRQVYVAQGFTFKLLLPTWNGF